MKKQLLIMFGFEYQRREKGYIKKNILINSLIIRKFLWENILYVF